MAEVADPLGVEPLQQQRCEDGPCQLRDPVDEREHGREAARDQEPERDRRVEVAAGDVADGRHHDGDCEAVRERDADEPEPGRRVGCALRERGGEELREGEGRARADEDEREGSDEFGEAPPHGFVEHRRGRYVADRTDYATLRWSPELCPARAPATASGSDG